MAQPPLASLASLAGLAAGNPVAGLASNAAGLVPGVATGLAGNAAVVGDTTGLAGIAGLAGVAGDTTGFAGIAGDTTGLDINKNDSNQTTKSKIDMIYDLFVRIIAVFMYSFAPSDLCNKENSRILLNVIMLYAINYIFKYQVEKNNYKKLKDIKDYLKIYKDFLLDKTLILSKDYLDIVHDAVEDIKLSEERDFTKQQDNDKMNTEKKIADNELTFNYVKMVVDNSSGLSSGLFSTITSAIANIWKVMMMWTKPFAGLVILVGFIAFIILVFFGEDDTTPENSGGVGTGSLVGSNNFNFFSQNMQGGKTNNNTDIISVLQRLPQNIYSFFDKLSAAYTRFSNYVNSSRDFMNSLADTTPIIKTRDEIRPNQPNNNEEYYYDNIYTFDYSYINSINPQPDIPDVDKNKYVYNIKKPKKNLQKISDYYNISHEDMFEKNGTSEYIYAPKCGTNNNYVEDNCTIKVNDNCDKEQKEDTSDYKNIII